MSVINQLNPKTFDFQTANYPSINLPTTNQMGLIAQEVELIFPDLVGMKEQQALIDSLLNQITTLTTCVNNANLYNTSN